MAGAYPPRADGLPKLARQGVSEVAEGWALSDNSSPNKQYSALINNSSPIKPQPPVNNRCKPVPHRRVRFPPVEAAPARGGSSAGG